MIEDNISVARDKIIRTSSRKLNIVVQSIVNMRVNNAVNQLKFNNKRISKTVLKVLNAAIANAENNKQLDIDNLIVKEAYVGKSLTMKRFRPRAKGRASPILKPFSRLTIILEEKKNLEREKLEKEKAQKETLEQGKGKSKEEDGVRQKQTRGK